MMFSTVRYFIKTSIIFLALGILTGLHMIVARYYSDNWPHPDVASAHTHVILIGGVMMMIMGVALWFFPRPAKEDKLYNPTIILVTYYTMTISTAVRFFATIISAYVVAGTILKFLIVISSAAQVVGMILFFISMWGRIRSLGSHLREAKGEKF